MTAATVSFQGAADGAAANETQKRALFQEVFTGEVLTAFTKKTIMDGRVRTRAVSGQKSAVFANTGRANGSFHTPGAEILGQNILHNSTTITVDDLLIADVFIADLYEAMNHYEVRGEYSRQLGEALARTRDKSLLRNVVKAARASNKITGLPGGTTIGISGFDSMATADNTKQEAFGAAVFQAHQTFIENDVPMDGIVCAVKPDLYFQLVQNKDLLNKDWGGLGSYATADLPMIAGIPLVMTNFLPQQADASNMHSDAVSSVDGGDIINAAHAVDSSAVRGLLWTPEAVGEVSLIDFSVQSDYDIRRQGTLMVARRATGIGVLRPECAIEITHTV